MAHVGALHVLFASLGFMAASKEADRPRLPTSRRTHHQPGPLEAFSALWHYNEVPFMSLAYLPFVPLAHMPFVPMDFLILLPFWHFDEVPFCALAILAFCAHGLPAFNALRQFSEVPTMLPAYLSFVLVTYLPSMPFGATMRCCCHWLCHWPTCLLHPWPTPLFWP